MAKVSAAARWGKKAKIDYDDMGRPTYNANGRALQSYIGSIARSMVPINIKSWPDVPENIKQKVWEEISGKKCHLAVKKRENVVAYGTIISDGGPNVMIHNVPLGEENFKVFVDVVLDEAAKLPIPFKSGPTIVSDAIGAIVGWPKELVIFPKKKKERNQPFSILDAAGQREKFKDVEKTLPMACKFIYSYVVRLMDEIDSIYVKFDDAMFGRPQGVWLLRQDIIPFMEMKEIGARHILVYMGHLYKYLKEAKRADSISFVDPGHIPTCPIDSDGSRLSQHIANQLEAVCRDSICLIPYNTGYHWILNIVNEDKNMIYLLDSTTNRCRDEAWKKIVTNGVKMYNASRGMPVFKQLTVCVMLTYEDMNVIVAIF